MEADEGATVTIELLGGETGHPVELDSDMNAVIRITDPMRQQIQVVATLEGSKTTTKTYRLTGLRLEAGN